MADGSAEEQLLAILRDGDKSRVERLVASLSSLATQTPNTNRIVLDERAPLDIARRFLEAHFQSDAGLRLLHARGRDLFRWDGTHYVPWSASDAHAALYLFLEHDLNCARVRARLACSHARPHYR